MCLPGRMDGRWKGLLCHKQLPAAHRRRVPPKCHLHIHWAGSGKPSHFRCCLWCYSSPSLLCQCFLSCFRPKLSSPSQSQGYFHMALSTQSSFLSVPIPVLSASCMVVFWQQIHFSKHITRCQVQRSSGDISQCHSTEVNGATQKHRDTNSPCPEYVHYVNHFNKLLCFIEMTE